MNSTHRPCILIPVYNHPGTITDIVNQLKTYHLPFILINDGSDKKCTAILRRLPKDEKTIALIEHPKNLGKGAAIKTGLYHAQQAGFSHVIQIDADGQHNHCDLPMLLDISQRYPGALVSGNPIYDQSVPRLRFYARYLTHIWVWINTLSFQIKDSMCGFRVYPVQQTIDAFETYSVGNRMDFETEIMVRMYWQGIAIKHFPTHVQYPENGVSHFRGYHDNYLLSKMHAKLFFSMLWQLPKRFTRTFSDGS